MTTAPTSHTRQARVHVLGPVGPSPQASTLVLVIDATDPAPVRVLPSAAARLGAGDQLIVAVLHPPARLTLNARLVAWQHTQRAGATIASLAPLLTRIDHYGLIARGVAVHTRCCTYRRSRRPRRHRIATALLRLCSTYHADYLVLAHSPDAGLLTGDTHHELTSQAPVDLRIHHVATTPAR